jgi:F-type H+-transporting ATPase subunit b
MPQLDPLIVPSQLFWLAVAFLVLYLVLARGALPRIGQVLEDREARIAHDLDEAERLKRETEKAIAEYEAELGRGRAKAQAILTETRARLASQAAEARSQLEQELADELKSAEQSLGRAKAKALGEIEKVAAAAAAETVRHLAGIEPSQARIKASLQAVATSQRG